MNFSSTTRICCASDHMSLCYASTYKKGGSFRRVEWYPENSYKKYRPSYNVNPRGKSCVLLYKRQLTRNYMSPDELAITTMEWNLEYVKGPSTVQLESLHGYDEIYYEAVKHRRCVVFCEGFYDWEMYRNAPDDLPNFYHLPQYNPQVKIHDPRTWIGSWSEADGWTGIRMAPLAAIYNVIRKEGGGYSGHDSMNYFAIITSPINGPIEDLNNSCPLVLDTQDKIMTWLDHGHNEHVVNILRNSHAPLMKYQVSDKVLKKSFSAISCIRPYSGKDDEPEPEEQEPEPEETSPEESSQEYTEPSDEGEDPSPAKRRRQL